MDFDEILHDVNTVITPSNSPMQTYWRDLQFIPPTLLSNLEIHYSASFLTEIQEKITGILSSDSKIYSIVSPPNTGCTTILVVLSVLATLENSPGIKVVWVSSSTYSLLGVKKIFSLLRPELKCTSEITDGLTDIFLISVSKDIFKKRADPSIFKNLQNIKAIVIDGAEEILEMKVNRDWVGASLIMNVYGEQTGTQPLVYISQYFQTSHVSTFIKELDHYLKSKYQICPNPVTVTSAIETLNIVPQFYSCLLDDPFWLKKLLENSKKPIRKSVLIFGSSNFEMYELLRYVEIDSLNDESQLLNNIESLRTGEVKIGICKQSLNRRIKTLGISCIVQTGFPMVGNEIDIVEYKSRVQRAYTPNYIGFSVVLIRQEHMAWVSSLSTKLGIPIGRLLI